MIGRIFGDSIYEASTGFARMLCNCYRDTGFCFSLSLLRSSAIAVFDVATFLTVKEFSKIKMKIIKVSFKRRQRRIRERRGRKKGGKKPQVR